MTSVAKQLLLFLLYSLTAQSAALGVSLRVQPILKNEGYVGLNAELSFRGCESGRTVVSLPESWGGEIELYKAIRDFRVQRGGRLEHSVQPASRVIVHSPGAQIAVQYRLVNDIESAPSKPKTSGSDYRANFAATHFHVLGQTLVPKPDCVSLRDPARFEIQRMPRGSVFASDLQHRTMGRKLTFNDLVESVMVGGDFRLIKVGRGSRLAVRGAWSFNDRVWRDRFRSIVHAQREYWRAGAGPFLVAVLQRVGRHPGDTSLLGTGLTDAFLLSATVDTPVESIVSVMSHEMMHTWIPSAIGRMPDEDIEPLAYWLSEGFTDWASWRTLMRSGLWKPEDFANALNDAVLDYDTSPVRDAPNQAVLERFWTDEFVQRLPYQRGMLLATYWDAAIQRASNRTKRFDDVLIEMQRLAKLSTAISEKSVTSILREAMQNVAQLDISEDLARFVDAGEPVAIDEHHFAPCGDFSQRVQKVFHRGFDAEATRKNKNIVTGVVPESPAYRAGLRDGMFLVARRDGKIGDSSKEIAYEVLDKNEKRILRYLPQGEDTVLIRTLQVSSTLTKSERAACVKRLAGLD